MDKVHLLAERETGIASGIKAAALVVILGIFAALADHALLASHGGTDGAVAAAVARVEGPAYAPALPAGLRAHEGEVPPHVEAF